MNTVTLFSDSAILPGTHAALASLLISSRQSPPLNIILFSDQISSQQKDLLHRTFELFKSASTFEIRDFSVPSLPGANPLHGSFTAYGRLFLSELLPDIDKCLYLDCDLIVACPLDSVFNQFDGTHVLLADGTGIRRWALESPLFKKAGLDLDGPCFNSGVLGIDLQLWRKNKCSALCEDVIARFPGQFQSADQAVLNVALHDGFKSLGEKINVNASPRGTRVPLDAQERIFHFLTSPKPWDPFGRFLHVNYPLWRHYYNQSASRSVSPLSYLSAKRCIQIIRPTIQATYERIFTRCE